MATDDGAERPVERRPALSQLLAAVSRGSRWVVLLVVAASIIVPIVYAFLGGFQDHGQLAANQSRALPNPWVFDELHRRSSAGAAFWQRALEQRRHRRDHRRSSSSSSRRWPRSSSPGSRFRGREALYTLFVLGLLFPGGRRDPAAVHPGPRPRACSDNPLGVALPQAAFGIPLTIVILRPFFRSIPPELEDAAAIDGCSPFGFFWRVLLPLARPALATVSGAGRSCGSWNAFLLPLSILGGTDSGRCRWAS